MISHGQNNEKQKGKCTVPKSIHERFLDFSICLQVNKYLKNLPYIYIFLVHMHSPTHTLEGH